MPVHAFVDESARDHTYLMAAVVVGPSQLTRLRWLMAGLRLPGQRELRFTKESPARRRHLADVIAGLPVEVYVYWRSWHRSDEPARTRCLARMVPDLLDRRTFRLVLDTRGDGKDVLDHRTLYRLLGPRPSATDLVYEHRDGADEPLLTIADAVAWCHGGGREWRKRVDPITAAVIELE